LAWSLHCSKVPPRRPETNSTQYDCRFTAQLCSLIWWRSSWAVYRTRRKWCEGPSCYLSQCVLYFLRIIVRVRLNFCSPSLSLPFRSYCYSSLLSRHRRSSACYDSITSWSFVRALASLRFRSRRTTSRDRLSARTTSRIPSPLRFEPPARYALPSCGKLSPLECAGDLRTSLWLFRMILSVLAWTHLHPRYLLSWIYFTFRPD